MNLRKISPGWAVPVAALVLALRMPDRFLNPQFYAEDAYFYECALTKGAKSLFLPYTGYLLSLQRAAAWFATTLPPLRVPLFFNAVALGLALFVLARIFSPRIALSPKPLLALAVVLIPHVEDIFLVFENLMWVTALGLVLLLISSDARSLGQRCLDWTMAIVFGLTGVYSILLLPLFLVRAWQRRSRESGALAAVIGTAALIQGWVVLHSPPYKIEPPDPFDPARVPAIFGLRVFAHLFGGNWLSGLSPFSLSLAGALLFIFLIRLCRASDLSPPERSQRRYFLAIICLLVAASIYRFKDELGMFLSPEHLDRYFFIPQVLCLWLILAEFSVRPARRALALALFSAFLVTAACFFRVEPMVDYRWKSYAPELRGRQPVSIPINPPGWFFHYPGNGKR